MRNGRAHVTLPYEPVLPVDPDASRSRVIRRIAVPLLLFVGVQFWLIYGRGYWGRNFQLYWLMVIAGLSLVPIVRRGVTAAIDRIDRAAATHRTIVTWAVAVLSGAYLAFNVFSLQRIVAPVFADDFSYLLQMRMLSQGRLWMPQHELADFFETLHVLVKPVYASIYFPGAAMLFVPGVWLGLSAWVIPVMASAAIVGLVYRIVAELMSDFEGLLAALFLVSLNWFRICSTMVASRIPAMLFGLLATWAWLRWRRNKDWRWAVAIGAFCGWGAITRPLDALCFAIPIGIAMIVDLWRPEPSRLARQRGLMTAAIALVAGTAPFLALQMVVNDHVTGHPLKTPFTTYAERDYPHTSYGLHTFDPSVRPMSPLQVKQDSYDEWVVPFIKGQQTDTVIDTLLNDRIPTTVACAFPNAFMVMLVPVGVLAMGRYRWVVAGVLPSFIVGYAFYAFFLQPYTVMAAPAAAVWVLAGRRAMVATWPLRGVTNTFLVGAIVMLCLTALPQTNRLVSDQPWPNVLDKVDDQLSRIETPAIVLFKYGGQFAKWPVFTTESAWPDDARVIRANDLGPRNVELFRYYAAKPEDRTVYRYDLATDTVERLGQVRELAH